MRTNAKKSRTSGQLRLPCHVLYIIDQLCESGGAERALLSMIRLLPKDRFRCSLVTFKIDRNGIFCELPCPVHVFPLRRTYGWNAVKTALALRRLIKSEGVSIVHTFFETSDLWGGLVAKACSDVALVSSRRDMGILRLPKHRLLYQILSFQFDLVLTVSEQVRTFCMEADRLPLRKVATLYNGIELERIAAANGTGELYRMMGLDDASHVVASVGHIRRVKGIDLLVRAAAKVCRQLPRARFLVIGDVHEPQYFHEVQELTKSLGMVENVQFLGPSEDVFSILKLCDVFCLPSRSEGFSNALVEAMACALPCVATRVGGNAEALEDGRSGFLTEGGDVNAIADKILLLLHNPELARRMGRAGREIVEQKFSAQAMINNLCNFYEQLLDRSR